MKIDILRQMLRESERFITSFSTLHGYFFKNDFLQKKIVKRYAMTHPFRLFLRLCRNDSSSRVGFLGTRNITRTSEEVHNSNF